MARKITSKTDNKGWTDPSKKKVRKKRKPMTEDQKAAAAERLEKARAVRAAKNPDYGMTGIHESLRDLPDDYPITPKKVKQWIKTQKELASMERRNEKKNVKGADPTIINKAYSTFIDGPKFTKQRDSLNEVRQNYFPEVVKSFRNDWY